MGFDDENGEPKQHIESILSDFTEWMKDNNYILELPISFWEYFDNCGIMKEFSSVEKAYTAFKLMTRGYIEQKG